MSVVLLGYSGEHARHLNVATKIIFSAFFGVMAIGWSETHNRAFQRTPQIGRSASMRGRLACAFLTTVCIAAAVVIPVFG
jgi:hypothetical protein